jgi:hypothetical protein
LEPAKQRCATPRSCRSAAASDGPIVDPPLHAEMAHAGTTPTKIVLKTTFGTTAGMRDLRARFVFGFAVGFPIRRW